MDNFFDDLSLLQNFFFSIFIILFLLLIISILNFNTFSPKNMKQVKLYGMFTGISNRGIYLISIYTIQYIFINWCILDHNTDSILLLIILLIFNLLSSIINFKLGILVIDVINSGMEYVVFCLCFVLSNFLIEVRQEWYVILILSLLILFMITYNTYLFLKKINSVVSSNKKNRKRGGLYEN